MKLIVGLGNPGSQYANTRHNIGFMVIDRLARLFPVSRIQYASWGVFQYSRIQQQDVLLLQPLTYMNRSGIAVDLALSECHESADHLVVIYDDLDLDLGRIRIRPRGGHGGHRGMKSIIDRLGMSQFVRMRLGIGRPPARDDVQEDDTAAVVQYVLQPFQPQEQSIVSDVITRTTQAIQLIVDDQLYQAMNEFNRS